MSNTYELSPEQLHAKRFLEDFYIGPVRLEGPITEGYKAAGAVKLVAYVENGDRPAIARWIVQRNGRVTEAWDPDYALNKYRILEHDGHTVVV